MKGVVTSYSYGGYTPNEYKLEFHDQSDNGGRIWVIFCHGSGGAAVQSTPWDTVYSQSIVFAELARHGLAVSTSDNSGPKHWANDTAISALDATVDFYGGKPIIFGYSMGGCLALNYASRHPTKIRGLILAAPASDLDYFEQDVTLQPDVWAAYSAANHSQYVTNAAGHNPISLVSGITLPTWVVTAVNDGTVPNSQVHSMYNLLGSSDKRIIDAASGNHTALWPYFEVDGLSRWCLGLT